MTPTFAPGDRVRVRWLSNAGKATTRIATVQYVAQDSVTVAMKDGRTITDKPIRFVPLPPAKPRGPGAGRPTTTATLRVGDALAVCDVTPDGTTPLRRYTVAAVEDTADGLRVELAGEGGSGMVVVR